MFSWDGEAWREDRVDLGCSSQPLVYADASGEQWVAGSSGAMARVVDGAWRCASPPASFEHFHAATAADGVTWFVGGNLFSPGDNYGTIARWAHDASSGGAR